MTIVPFKFGLLFYSQICVLSIPHNNYCSPSDKVSVPLCYRYLSKTRIEKFIHDKLHQQPFVSLRNRSK